MTQEKEKAATVVGAVSDELEFGSRGDRPVARTMTHCVINHGKLVPAMFRVRKLACERNIDLSQVKGSGPGGCVLESDLKK